MRAAVGGWLAQVEDVMAALEQHMDRLKHTQHHHTAATKRDDDERAKLTQLLTAARTGALTEQLKQGETVNGVRLDAAVMQAVQVVTGGGEGKVGKRGEGGGGGGGRNGRWWR